MVLTTNTSPGGGQIIASVVRPCSASFLTTLHIGSLEERFWCSSISLPLFAFASLTVNLDCLESKISGAGVSPDFLSSAPGGVMGSYPRMDLACRLRRSWRPSRLPTSLGSHWSLLPYSATAWMHPTSMALTLSGTTQYVVVRVLSKLSTALAFFRHQLCCSSNIRCSSIQMTSKCGACVSIRMNLFPTIIVVVSFGRMCFPLPCLHVHGVTSIFGVSNCSLNVLAHSMFLAAHLSRLLTTWLTLLPVATQPRSFPKDSHLAFNTYSSTNMISLELLIAKRIGDTGEPCGTHASTGCLSMALSSIIISTVLSERKLSVHPIWSPSICLTFIKSTSLPSAKLGKAV